MDVALSIVTITRPETTQAVTRGAARLLVALDYAPLPQSVGAQLIERLATIQVGTAS